MVTFPPAGMKFSRLIAIIGLIFPISFASGSTFYVDLNSAEPLPPYSSWETAATNIQDAVALATAGDLVLVTNGIYSNSDNPYPANSRVALTNEITVESVNGAANTIIDGGNSLRCAYLSGHAYLIGFTLTNGYSSLNGGGVYGASGNEQVINCIL